MPKEDLTRYSTKDKLTEALDYREAKLEFQLKAELEEFKDKDLNQKHEMAREEFRQYRKKVLEEYKTMKEREISEDKGLR